jgi:LPXTG-site transpeptidase (sortase) family protein
MRIALMAAILAVASVGWSARPPAGQTRAPFVAAVPSASPLVSSPQPEVAPSSTPAPAGAITPARLLIPKLGVDAPVETKGLDGHHVMEAPDKPSAVAWYPFTAKPGAGTNAVFAGHLDDASVGPAVFWRLGDLKPGDTITVRDGSGAELAFSVSSVSVYPLTSAPVQEIIGPTPSSAVTLITCAGSYNRQSGLYDKRLVVRARQV